jgi:hypothetical protein
MVNISRVNVERRADRGSTQIFCGGFEARSRAGPVAWLHRARQEGTGLYRWTIRDDGAEVDMNGPLWVTSTSAVDRPKAGTAPMSTPSPTTRA